MTYPTKDSWLFLNEHLSRLSFSPGWQILFNAACRCMPCCLQSRRGWGCHPWLLLRLEVLWGCPPSAAGISLVQRWSRREGTRNSISRMAWWMLWVWRCLLPVVFARTHWPCQDCWRLSILPVCVGCRPVLARCGSLLQQTCSCASGQHRYVSSHCCGNTSTMGHTRESALLFSWWSPYVLALSSQHYEVTLVPCDPQWCSSSVSPFGTMLTGSHLTRPMSLNRSVMVVLSMRLIRPVLVAAHRLSRFSVTESAPVTITRNL